MASSTKQLDLIDELISQTKTGRLRWSKSTVKGAYMLAFPTNVIRIQQTGQGSVNHVLSIFDGSGNELVSISDNPFGVVTGEDVVGNLRLAGLLTTLYQYVRQVVESEDQDKVIDEVLTDLRQLGSRAARQVS